MPRANRHFLPGYVWHITHRCHRKSFLLKFARDRRSYLRWVLEAKKRFGLSVLDYIVTSNHIHILVRDMGRNVIADSMQLIAGRTGQEYNQRKERHGAFWEDRYHATAIDVDEHLHHCLVYIDLNMVRAGVVKHPSDWAHSGYREIQNPPKRYGIIDLRELSSLCGFSEVAKFQQAHGQWVEEALSHEMLMREGRWSEAIAVGSLSFVDNVKSELGFKAAHREVIGERGTYALRERSEPYGCVFAAENEVLRLQNTRFWDQNTEGTAT
jgi:REP element-mobilizing transposase RayT